MMHFLSILKAETTKKKKKKRKESKRRENIFFSNFKNKRKEKRLYLLLKLLFSYPIENYHVKLIRTRFRGRGGEGGGNKK